jgi:hypothetical protein
LEAAHRGLDLLSVEGVADLSIQNPDEDHLVWWLEGSRLIMRLFAILTSTFQLSAALTVRDAAGHIVRQLRSRPVWHESFRFFRLAQVTDDAFDAYRNLFLALECVLDDRYPKTQREADSVWLRGALGQIHSSASLATFAAANSKDPVADIVHDLYSTTRTSVFHAKSNRPHFLPGERSGARRLRENLERLARLYLFVVQHELDTRRASSAISRYAFDHMTSLAYGDALVLAVSDDGAPFDEADTELNPSGGAVVPLTTRPAPEYDEAFVRNWLGSVEVAALSRLSRIARVGALRDGGVVFVQLRDNILTVGGFDILEARLAYRVENQGPRRIYPR